MVQMVVWWFQWIDGPHLVKKSQSIFSPPYPTPYPIYIYYDMYWIHTLTHHPRSTKNPPTPMFLYTHYITKP
jgi:hypothetical protein